MKIQLTISLLVSDRIETLRRCLTSLKPLLRELDSELIAVFTGKNKDTLELIQQYAALVIPFTWCNDFSKARNAGLELAKGEWFLYLDDDEWFDNTEEIINFFKSGEYKRFQSAFYQQRNYSDWEGKNYSDASVGRMCRLTTETHFILPIHEYLQPFLDPQKNLQCFVHHYGYLEKSVDKSHKSSKSDRNIPLLLERLEKADEFDSFHCCMQLAQEYRNRGEYETAIEYCEKGLNLARKQKRIYAPEMWMQVYLPVLISYTGDSKRALERSERLLKSSRILEVCSAHIASTIVSLCYELGEYQKGLKYVQLFHQNMSYLQHNPEKAMLQKSGDITFSFAEGRAVLTYINGLFFASETCQFPLMKTFLGWIPWDDTVRVSAHYSNLEEWKAKYQDQNNIILEGYSCLKTKNAYVDFQKALYAEKCNHNKETERFWTLCVQNCPEQLLCQTVEMAVRNQFLLTPLMEKMTITIWDSCTRILAEHIQLMEMDSFYEKVAPLLKDYPLYASRLEQHFLERQISQGLVEHSKLVKLLHRYCENLLSDAKKIYRDEVIFGTVAYILPPEYHFAFLIDKVLRLIECGKYTECISPLKEAFHTVPEMAIVVSQLTRYLTEQMEKPPQTVSKEFELLGDQVKQVLTELMDKQQWQEAYGVTGRLVTLLPDDLEVLRVKQEILRQGA